MSARHVNRLPSVTPAPLPLPPLRYAIYRHGKLERIGEMQDPRARFCEGFNELCGDMGAEARPLAAEGTVRHE